MKLCLALISPRRTGPVGPVADLIKLYLKRSAGYISTELRVLSSEIRLLEFLEETAARTRPALFLTDSRGQQLSSEEFSGAIDSLLNNGIQQFILAIGPADGWSSSAIKRADRMIAFGRITLPHELAAVVAAEQLYRALTIRAGHPYHCGH